MFNGHKMSRILTAALLLMSSASGAQMLTGMVQFSTDASGNFCCNQSWNTQGPDAAWNLYVIQGASGPFINHGDGATTSISVPLTPGTYTFTMNAERNPAGAFSFAGLNLFFNGNAATPGISVFAPIDTTGGLPDPGTTRDLAVVAFVPGANTLTTTVGGMQVTLSNFLFNTTTATDLVSAGNDVPSGTADFVTTFTLTVTALASNAVAVPALQPVALALLAALVAAMSFLIVRRRSA